jgi:acyl carrier protein
VSDHRHSSGDSPGRDELVAKVLGVVVQTLDAGRGPLGPDTALFYSGGRFDSFAVLQLVMRLEQTFGLSIPDEDLDRDRFNSVRAIAGYLHDRLRVESGDIDIA